MSPEWSLHVLEHTSHKPFIAYAALPLATCASKASNSWICKHARPSCGALRQPVSPRYDLALTVIGNHREGICSHELGPHGLGGPPDVHLASFDCDARCGTSHTYCLQPDARKFADRTTRNTAILHAKPTLVVANAVRKHTCRAAAAPVTMLTTCPQPEGIDTFRKPTLPVSTILLMHRRRPPATPTTPPPPHALRRRLLLARPPAAASPRRTDSHPQQGTTRLRSHRSNPTGARTTRLCVDDEGVRSTGLEPRLPKCGIYGGDKEQVTAEASKPRIEHQLDGFTAAGTPLGSSEYVSNALGQRAATVETLVDTLVQLPLSVQSQFLLLRASLQARMVHLMRTVSREALAHMRRTDAAVWRAPAAVLYLPPGVGEYGADMEGPDKACSTLGRQIMLPLRHGGLGLHIQSDDVLDAAFVAGVGQAERNLKGRLAALCPL